MPEVVIGLPEILKKAGTDAATEVTVPPEFTGTAQVPSPRKKFEDDGVPVTGLAEGAVTEDSKVPLVGNVMLVVLDTASVVAKAPDVVKLPPSVIVLPVFAIPVPPFAPNSTPDSVTAPEVAVLGVNPVVPAENVVTGEAFAELANSVTVPELFL